MVVIPVASILRWTLRLYGTYVYLFICHVCLRSSIISPHPSPAASQKQFLQNLILLRIKNVIL